jgi:predicted nucleic acid-binding protein
MVDAALYDTSALIAELRVSELVGVSVMSFAELRIGVLRAGTTAARAARLERLHRLEGVVAPFDVDRRVSGEYARIASLLRDEGRAVRTIDTLIAATAVSVGLPLVTLDGDFSAIARIAGLELVPAV